MQEARLALFDQSVPTVVFLLSIPVGPINFTIINEGARRGFKWALLIGLGASAMEVVYCTIAFTSFASSPPFISTVTRWL